MTTKKGLLLIVILSPISLALVVWLLLGFSNHEYTGPRPERIAIRCALRHVLIHAANHGDEVPASLAEAELEKMEDYPKGFPAASLIYIPPSSRSMGSIPKGTPLLFYPSDEGLLVGYIEGNVEFHSKKIK